MPSWSGSTWPHAEQAASMRKALMARIVNYQIEVAEAVALLPLEETEAEQGRGAGGDRGRRREALRRGRRQIQHTPGGRDLPDQERMPRPRQEKQQTDCRDHWMSSIVVLILSQANRDRVKRFSAHGPNWVRFVFFASNRHVCREIAGQAPSDHTLPWRVSGFGAVAGAVRRQMLKWLGLGWQDFFGAFGDRRRTNASNGMHSQPSGGRLDPRPGGPNRQAIPAG